MQRLGVSGAVRPIYGSLGVKRLNKTNRIRIYFFQIRSYVKKFYIFVSPHFSSATGHIACLILEHLAIIRLSKELIK